MDECSLKKRLRFGSTPVLRFDYCPSMFESDLLAIDGGTVEVLVGGDGDRAFVTTHPFQYNVEQPSSLAAALSDIGRSIQVAPRGFGRSSEDDAANLGVIQLVRDLDAVRTALGIDRWVMVGQSGGGYVALAYALTHPSRLDALVLSCTSATQGLGSSSVYHPDNPDHTKVQEALADGRLSVVSSLIAHRPDLLSENRGAFSTPHREAFGREVSSLRLPERLAEISTPTLVIVGQHDRAIPPEHGRVLAEQIAGARLVTFENSGRFPYEEEPDRFRTVLADFCDSLP